jgi:hypothetical protein
MRISILVFSLFFYSSLFAGSPDDFTGQWLIREFQAEERIDNHKKREDDYADYVFLCGYISGVAMTGNQLWWQYPSHNTLHQFEAVIIKYMNAHPEQWGDHANIIIGRAFKEAFPLQIKRN